MCKGHHLSIYDIAALLINREKIGNCVSSISVSRLEGKYICDFRNSKTEESAFNGENAVTDKWPCESSPAGLRGLG